MKDLVDQKMESENLVSHITRNSKPSKSYLTIFQTTTVWKVYKYGIIFYQYFPVFGLNNFITNKYLDTFHAVSCNDIYQK